MDAYSYTTVSVESDGTAKVHVAMHPDEDVTVYCTPGRDRAQISVMHARADVTICPTDATAPSTGDVQVARQLAAAFATYAAEVERLHNENAAGAADTAA
ncbi:hypothetical protein E1293_28500 [Actinomadura darangshiensis]|uniref:Uncharacterized protein n=1 Tax=Actinomadura darangshiensis TaxID=705336 RepID=A0A4R5ARI3_9ACTN|nr:hypothetical protein [Actinomadura darangshiensis]TDD75323.1 hypothetical protein E1293_28500 [Actinomadura darangshiensis]